MRNSVITKFLEGLEEQKLSVAPGCSAQGPITVATIQKSGSCYSHMTKPKLPINNRVPMTLIDLTFGFIWILFVFLRLLEMLSSLQMFFDQNHQFFFCFFFFIFSLFFWFVCLFLIDFQELHIQCEQNTSSITYFVNIF